MWYDLRHELVKISSQKKNFIVVVGHAVLMVVVALAITFSRYEGPMATRLRDAGIELRDFIDGIFFARTLLLPTLVMIFPIFICTLAGDLIAGEIQDGSLKLYASRPRSRTGILLAKFGAMCVAAFFFCFYFMAAGLITGVLFFGLNQTQVIPLLGTGLEMDFTVMSSVENLERYVYCVFYHTLSVIALGSVTLLFSTLFNRMTSATIAGLTVYFVSYVLQSLPWLEPYKHYLISQAMNGSVVLWMTDIPLGRLFSDLSILGIYTIFATAASVVVFSMKDIR